MVVRVDYSTAWPTVDSRWPLPVFVLLGDGTAIIRSPDEGVLRAAKQRKLSSEQVACLFRMAERAGLFRSRTYARNDVLDGSVLIVRLTLTTGQYETTVHQPDPRDSGVRGRIAAFADAIQQLGEPTGEYRPQRMAVLVVGSSDGSDSRAIRRAAVATSTPLAAMPNGCLLVDGADLSAVPALSEGVTSRTRWAADGQRVALVVRPLLPNERSCADLTKY